VTEITLIEELLHNVQASGNQVLERRLADTAVWFYKNKDRIARDNLAARQAFLEKGFWIMLEINALLLQRIRESRPGADLWLPTGMLSDGKGMRSYG
jgi:hypothetical protein